MVVKSERGRRRYVFFEVPEGTRRDDVSAALDGIQSVKVITCAGGEAVVRCSPAERADVAVRMGSAFDGCRSVRTSGTLRGLRDRYPSLRVPQKRKRRSGLRNTLRQIFIGRALSRRGKIKERALCNPDRWLMTGEAQFSPLTEDCSKSSTPVRP